MDWILSHPALFLIGPFAVVTILSLLLRHEKKQQQERDKAIECLFADRPTLDDVTFYTRFFSGTQYPIEMITSIRRIFLELFDMIDLSKLGADDDLSGHFRVLWDLDSLVDVEIVIALEEKFDITITNAEAESMTSFRKIVECVYQKVEEKERLHE